MILYHGSSVEVKKPSLQYSREDIDFGAGFYLTPDLNMAKKWASSKKNSVVSIYEVDIEELSKYEFGLNEEWLHFVRDNRMLYKAKEYDYDILIGPTADDKLYNTLNDYFDGLLSEEQAVELLNIAGFSDQYVFKKEDAINEHCHFINSIVIEPHEKNQIRQISNIERTEVQRKTNEYRMDVIRRRQEREAGGYDER